MIYDISYKTLIGLKPWRIRFGKIDGVIRICDRSWYLILFGNETYDAIYDEIGSYKCKKWHHAYYF